MAFSLKIEDRFLSYTRSTLRTKDLVAAPSAAPRAFILQTPRLEDDRVNNKNQQQQNNYAAGYPGYLKSVQ
jgi:hypothetical protein